MLQNRGGERRLHSISLNSFVFPLPLCHSLVLGLMCIYVDVDIVEGLDVDKEKFDKYSVRRNIASLLNDSWEIADFRESFLREAKSQIYLKFVGMYLYTDLTLVTFTPIPLHLSIVFLSYLAYLGTVINDAIHLLEDSLGRLMDIRSLELAMADQREWDTQDPLIKQEREK